MTDPTHDTYWAESAKGNYWRLENGVVLVVDNINTPKFSKLLYVGCATLWRMVREGRFPAPYKLGPNTTVWKCGEVRRYLRDRVGQTLSSKSYSLTPRMRDP